MTKLWSILFQIIVIWLAESVKSVLPSLGDGFENSGQGKKGMLPVIKQKVTEFRDTGLLRRSQSQQCGAFELYCHLNLNLNLKNILG